MQVDVVAALHTSGITHCAISPEHVLIGADGHLVLTGFSHATVSGPNSPRDGLLSSASRMLHVAQPDRGRSEQTGEWSAPEAILGWTCDSTVDCWGFGAVLYFMLTGQVIASPLLSLLD